MSLFGFLADKQDCCFFLALLLLCYGISLVFVLAGLERKRIIGVTYMDYIYYMEQIYPEMVFGGFAVLSFAVHLCQFINNHLLIGFF